MFFVALAAACIQSSTRPKTITETEQWKDFERTAYSLQKFKVYTYTTLHKSDGHVEFDGESLSFKSPNLYHYEDSKKSVYWDEVSATIYDRLTGKRTLSSKKPDFGTFSALGLDKRQVAAPTEDGPSFLGRMTREVTFTNGKASDVQTQVGWSWHWIGDTTDESTVWFDPVTHLLAEYDHRGGDTLHESRLRQMFKWELAIQFAADEFVPKKPKPAFISHPSDRTYLKYVPNPTLNANIGRIIVSIPKGIPEKITLYTRQRPGSQFITDGPNTSLDTDLSQFLVAISDVERFVVLYPRYDAILQVGGIQYSGKASLVLREDGDKEFTYKIKPSKKPVAMFAGTYLTRSGKKVIVKGGKILKL